MTSRLPTLLGLFAAIALAPTLHSQTVLFDSQGFNAPTYTTGALVGQNGWGRIVTSGNTLNPQIVEDGGNRYVLANAGGSNWFAPTISHTPSANEIVVVEARLARTLGTSSSYAYAIDMYGASGRIGRAGLVAFGGQIYGFVTTLYNTGTNAFDPLGTPQDIIRTDPLVADQFYSFQIFINFATKTFSVNFDGESIGQNLPFRTPTATSLQTADFQVSSNTTRNDQGRLDDYRVYTTVIPEPSAAAGLAGVAALGLAATRRRRRVCA